MGVRVLFVPMYVPHVPPIFLWTFWRVIEIVVAVVSSSSNGSSSGC